MAQRPEPPLASLSTELANPATSSIDALNSLDLVTLINSQDAYVTQCISPVLPQIAHAIDQIVPRLRNGGRVLYFGAGTSGRLGILDASECMPTFNCDQFVGVMAGGDEAIRKVSTICCGWFHPLKSFIGKRRHRRSRASGCSRPEGE
jgi:N-acetylmuramic acid 6-phosphate etherase